MRRAITALVITTVVVVLLASFKPRVPALNAGVLPRSAVTAQATATPTSTVSSRRRRRVVTATGSAIQYQYGVIQLKAKLTNGRVTTISMAQFQPEPGRSQFIDAQAIPLLRAEALKAGSANIDAVSGATYTSEAYARSLQSAIDRAKA